MLEKPLFINWNKSFMLSYNQKCLAFNLQEQVLL